MFFWKYPPSIIYIFLSRFSLYSTPKHYSYKPCSVQNPSSISAALVFLHLRLKWRHDNPMSRFSALNYESDTYIPLLHFSFFYLNRKSDTLMHVLFKKTTGTRDVCRASAFLHVPLKRFWSRWMSCSSALSHKSCIYISAALLSLSNLIASHTPRYVCPKSPSLKRMFAALLSSSVCNSNAGCGAPCASSSAFNHKSNYHISLLHIYLSEISKQSKPPHWFCFKMATYTHQASTTLLSSSIYSLKDK